MLVSLPLLQVNLGSLASGTPVVLSTSLFLHQLLHLQLEFDRLVDALCGLQS